MGGGCPEGQFWDALVKKCLPCLMICQPPHTNARCTEYCVSAECKAVSGQYYDRLLRKCVRCAEVCGRHPAECSHHCQIRPPALTPIQKPVVEVALHTPTFRGRSVPTALPDSVSLLYSLLALCVLLLLSSLSVALAVFLRRARASTSRPGPRGTNQAREGVVQLGKEVGQPGRSSKGFLTDSNIFHPTEPADDSSPTETCVCVHCFPDLRVPGQGDERPPRPPFSFYQQADLQRTKSQKVEPLWAQEVQEQKEEVAVG